MRLEGNSDQLMILAAFRYCLGRRSYIVSTFHSVWERTKDQVFPNYREIVLKETLEALAANDAGDWSDRESWKRIAEGLLAELVPGKSELTEYIQRFEVSTRKDWPLRKPDWMLDAKAT